MRLRQLLPAALVGFVACGVAELLYRGYVGARQRWSDEPREIFELYTHGLPPGTGARVAELFCGRLAKLPIVVREHAEPLSLRDRLRYRLKDRPSAALLALPSATSQPLVYHSLLLSRLLRPPVERRRLVLEARSAGALPVLIGDKALAEELEATLAESGAPEELAAALSRQRGEPARCLSQPATGR